MSDVLAWFATAAVAAFLSTLACERLAPRLGLVARPRDDRWHQGDVPLLGGAAILFVTTAATLAAGRAAPQLRVLALFAAAAGLLGLVDDRWSLRPQTKLIGQILLAVGLHHWGFTLSVTASPVANVLLTLLWLVGVTNAFNLLDNMDGLAAGIAVVAAGFRCILFLRDGDVPAALAAAALGGAALGFLGRNAPPARIFMGDAGSLYLGFFFAGLSLAGSQPYSRGVGAVLLTPVLVLLVPIFDTAFVTITRWLSGRSVAEGGRDHTSHRLIALGVSERWVLVFFWTLAAAAGAIAYLSYEIGQLVAWGVGGLLGAAVVLLGVYLASFSGVSGVHVRAPKGAIRVVADFPGKRHVVTLIVDVGLLVLACYGAFLIRYEGDVEQHLPAFTRVLPVLVGVQLAALAASRLYRGVWHHTGIGDLLRLGAALGGGTVAAALAFAGQYGARGYSRSVVVLDGILALLLLGGARLSFQVFAELLRRHSPSARRVLIYGAGHRGALAARELLQNPAHDRRPVGFLDDDPAMAGLRIHGVPILGGLEALPRLLPGERIAEVIVASASIAERRIEELTRICSGARVPVVSITVRLE